MDKLESNDPIACGSEPQWHRPSLTVVAIEEITLGKLGSSLDLNMDNNYSE